MMGIMNLTVAIRMAMAMADLLMIAFPVKIVLSTVARGDGAMIAMNIFLSIGLIVCAGLLTYVIISEKE